MFSSWNFRGELDFVDQWTFMKTPLPLIFISITYLWFVLKAGPKFMKNRTPFNINTILIFYNIIQVIYCIYLTYNGAKVLFQYGLLPKSCMMDTKENRYMIATTIYAYFFIKVVELLDTVFFVLRKKSEQITFLHIYHHVVMMWCAWFILKYVPSYDSFFLRTINSFVHVVMYGYYALAVFPRLTKFLWWKKYITSLQLIQFMLVMLHATACAIHKGCQPTKSLMLMVYGNGSLFLYLFGKFYIASYLQKNNKLKGLAN